MENKDSKNLEIIWTHFFNGFKKYIERNIVMIQMETSIPLGIKYRDTYAFYSVSLWYEFCRLIEKNIDKDPWEIHSMLIGESVESLKLRINMMRNARRNTNRDLLLENGHRRKSDRQIAKERKKLFDSYREISPTHEGMGVDVISSRYVKVNSYEPKFKSKPKVNMNDLKLSHNNIEEYVKEQDAVNLLQELLSSKKLSNNDKELLLNLILFDDKEKIRLKEKISIGTLNKRIYRLKVKVKKILMEFKNEVA